MKVTCLPAQTRDPFREWSQVSERSHAGGFAGASRARVRGVPREPADFAEEVCWVPVLVPASALSHVGGLLRLSPDGEILPPLHVVRPERVCDPLSDRCEGLAESRGLSTRELEVLRCIARGRNAQYLERRLGISLSTAKTHIAHVYRKLGVNSQQELLDLIEEDLGRGSDSVAPL